MAHRTKKYASTYKFSKHDAINKMIDNGEAGAVQAKRMTIKRETGACRRPQSIDKQYWAPNGHNLAR